jgi:hypothetical protein
VGGNGGKQVAVQPQPVGDAAGRPVLEQRPEGRQGLQAPMKLTAGAARQLSSRSGRTGLRRVGS